ncbi:hypothetical protein MTY59_33670 [Mycobacterium senriense]|uniref:Uncharacterized protein n=1 Tax=Mycobacterium senriense TaxID=2775496 RepID=A0ABM7SQC6_9MYCO|nr:hypothetical protein MTY59_33670 [Mycobacterium senriense]
MLVEPLRAAHVPRVLTAPLEILERFAPILGFRHAYVLPHGDSSRDHICGVTYWIAYCKVTRMSDAAGPEVDGASQIEESQQ